jgi:hypothetical protein
MAAGPTFGIFGIPVRIDPTFFVIAVLLGFGAGDLTFLVSWVVVVFGPTASIPRCCSRAWAG